MMLDRLVGILQATDLAPSAEQIADCLWLAAHLPVSDQSNLQPSAPTPDRPAPPSTPADRKQPPDREQTSQSGSVTTVTQEKISYYPGVEGELVEKLESYAGMSNHESVQPWLFHSPTSIRSPLEIVRALRPLARRVNSRTRTVLDEDATIHQSAELDSLTLVMRPARERWLDLAIVVDEAPSITIWHDWIDALYTLLIGTGAFRDVRIWTMHYDPQVSESARDTSNVYFQVRKAHTPGEQRRPLEALIDPQGRRAILIVSDCISVGWRKGAFVRACYQLSRTNIVSLIQLLPPHLWRRTTLAYTDRAWISATRRISNANDLQLHMPQPSYAPRDVATHTGSPEKPLPMPITAVDPKLLSQWARMISGQSSSLIPAMLLSRHPVAVHEPSVPNVLPSSLQRLKYFQGTATLLAKELAKYLALARPLTFPVMRLIQQVFVPTSTEIHLAEIFNSGMLKPWRSDQPQPGCYAFPEDITEELRQDFSQPQTVEQLQQISVYLTKHTGLTTTFRAFLANRDVESEQLLRGLAPFAEVMIKIILDGFGTTLGRSPSQTKPVPSFPKLSKAVEAAVAISHPLGSPSTQIHQHTRTVQAPILFNILNHALTSGDETAQLIEFHRLLNQGVTTYKEQSLADLRETALDNAATTLIERAAELARSASNEVQKGLQRFRPERLSNAVSIYDEIVDMLGRGDLVMDSEPDSQSADLVEQISQLIRQRPKILDAESDYRQKYVSVDELYKLLERLKPQLDQTLATLHPNDFQALMALRADEINLAVDGIEQIRQQLPKISQRVEIALQRARFFQRLIQIEQLITDGDLDQAEQQFRELLERKDSVAQEFRPRINASLNTVIQRRAERAVQLERVEELEVEAQTYRGQQTSAGFEQAIGLYHQIFTFPAVRDSLHQNYAQQKTDLEREYADFLAPFIPLITARHLNNTAAQVLELRLLLKRQLRTDEQGNLLEEQLIALRDDLVVSLLAQAHAVASQAKTQFAQALRLRDQRQASVAADSYARSIAMLEQPISRQSLEAFANGRSDFDRVIDALNREIRDQAEVQDVLRRYRDDEQAATGFAQLLSRFEQAEAALLAGNVDDAHKYYSEAAVLAATSTIPVAELTEELWKKALDGLDRVKAARQDPRIQQERAELAALELEVDGLLESESVENYKQALNLLARMLRSPVLSNDPQSYQRYSQRRTEIEQRRDHLLAIFQQLTTARQLADIAAEMIKLRVLIDRGQSIGLDGESLSERLANLSKQFVTKFLKKAGDYASQARTTRDDGLYNLDPERFVAADRLYEQAINILQQPDLQPAQAEVDEAQAEVDEAQPEEIKRAVAYLRQRLGEQQELREMIQRYRTEQRELNLQSTRVQRAHEIHDLAIKDLNDGNDEAAINRLKVAASQLRPDISPVIVQALDRADRVKVERVISDLERALIEARAAFAQGRSEEASKHLVRIEDQGAQFSNAASIRVLLAQAHVLEQEIYDHQSRWRALSAARPINLAEYERLFSQLDALRAAQPQSPEVADLGAQLVRGAAEIARDEARRAIEAGDPDLRTIRQLISAVARRLSDLPDEPPRSRRRREIEEALQRIQAVLTPD